MTHVIVHRIKFDLKVRSRPQALRAQEIASRFVAQALPEILQNGLADPTWEDVHLTFDRLDLQLGAIDERDFADHLPVRTARALAEALFAARHGRPSTGAAPPRETSVVARRREILAAFLQHGLFVEPESATEPQTPGGLLMALIESDQDLAAWLSGLCRDGREVASRLARQFPDDALARLVRTVWPSAGEAVMAFAAAMERVPTRVSGRARAEWAAQWEAILGAALGPRANEAELLAELARVGRRYAETYSDGLIGQAALGVAPPRSPPRLGSTTERARTVSEATFVALPAATTDDADPAPAISVDIVASGSESGDAMFRALPVGPSESGRSGAIAAGASIVEPSALAAHGPDERNPPQNPSSLASVAAQSELPTFTRVRAPSPRIAVEAIEGERNAEDATFSPLPLSPTGFDRLAVSPDAHPSHWPDLQKSGQPETRGASPPIFVEAARSQLAGSDSASQEMTTHPADAEASATLHADASRPNAREASRPIDAKLELRTPTPTMTAAPGASPLPAISNRASELTARPEDVGASATKHLKTSRPNVQEASRPIDASQELRSPMPPAAATSDASPLPAISDEASGTERGAADATLAASPVSPDAAVRAVGFADPSAAGFGAPKLGLLDKPSLGHANLTHTTAAKSAELPASPAGPENLPARLTDPSLEYRSPTHPTGPMPINPPSQPNNLGGVEIEGADSGVASTAESPFSPVLPADASTAGPRALEIRRAAEPRPRPGRADPATVAAPYAGSSPPISVQAAESPRDGAETIFDAFAASPAAGADRLEHPRNAVDRQASAQAILDGAPRDFALNMLRELVPTHAGFIETVLLAIHEVEAPAQRVASPDPLGFALSFALELEGARFDAKRFVAAAGRLMAEKRGISPEKYLDLIAREASRRKSAEERYAPLAEILTSLRNSRAAGPSPSAERAEGPELRSRAPGSQPENHRGSPSGETPIEGRRDEGARRETSDEFENADRLLGFIAHIAAFDDFPSEQKLGRRPAFASALFEALETQPAAALVMLRRMDPTRLARTVVRYLSRQDLHRLIEILATGEADPILHFLTIWGDWVGDIDRKSATLFWRTGFETILSERSPPRFDRFVEAMRAGLAREPDLARLALGPFTDEPSRQRQPANAMAAAANLDRAATPDEEDVLFGPPLDLADEERDPLALLRHLLRYGVPSKGSAGIEAWETTIDRAVTLSPTAAKRLIAAAFVTPLARWNLTSQLSAATLQRLGRLVLTGDGARALAFVADLHASAPGQTAPIAAVYDALFAAAAAAPALPLADLLRAASAAFTASGGSREEKTTKSWREAPGSSVASSAAAAVGLQSRTRKPRSSSDVSIRVKNAGLVLLHPHLGSLFARLGLFVDGAFLNDEARAGAVDALEHLAFGRLETREYQLALDKILCGIELAAPLAAGYELDERARALCESLLRSFGQAWTPLKNSSIATLREAFLQRDGLLTWNDEAWTLKVAAKPYDMLLDSMPWPFKLIKTRWMTSLVKVEWR